MACCRGLLTLTVPELLAIDVWLAREGITDRTTAAQTGCPFRRSSPGGCRIYPVRPLICRRFGWHYLHPALSTQPHCARLPRIRPGDDEAAAWADYRAFGARWGWVCLGVASPETPVDPVNLADNREALDRYPELSRLRGWLLGPLPDAPTTSERTDD